MCHIYIYIYIYYVLSLTLALLKKQLINSAKLISPNVNSRKNTSSKLASELGRNVLLLIYAMPTAMNVNVKHPISHQLRSYTHSCKPIICIVSAIRVSLCSTTREISRATGNSVDIDIAKPNKKPVVMMLRTRCICMISMHSGNAFM
jgi:hypothetical protein